MEAQVCIVMDSYFQCYRNIQFDTQIDSQFCSKAYFIQCFIVLTLQVKVLEYESDLEKERVRLAELRKKHYQLAGESEGWEQEVRKTVF